MPDQRRSDGSALTYKWLVGILVTILLAGGAGWMTNISAQVTSITVTTTSHEARIASVETTAHSIERHLSDIRQTLHRMEDRVTVIGDRRR